MERRGQVASADLKLSTQVGHLGASSVRRFVWYTRGWIQYLRFLPAGLQSPKHWGVKYVTCLSLSVWFRI